MSTKDEIIDNFSQIDPGLRHLINIVFPNFDTWHVDENDVIHLADKMKRVGISIQIENKKSAIIVLRLAQVTLDNCVSLCFRLSVIDGQIGGDGLEVLRINALKELGLDVD